MLNVSLVSRFISDIANGDKLWQYLAVQRWPQVDWNIRAEHLARQIPFLCTKDSKGPIKASFNKILYAQQMCISSPALGTSTENDLRLLRTHIREQHKQPNEYQYIKMALLGDPGVGRSSLCLAAIHKIWPPNPLFISSRSYVPEIDDLGGRVWNTTLHICLYEDSNELYSFHTEVYEPSQNKDSIARSLKNCDVALLAFDLTSRESFDNIHSSWVPLLKSIPTLLVGLKEADHLRVVESDEAWKMVTDYSFLKYAELSIRDLRSIDIFQDALLSILPTQQKRKESCAMM